MVAPRPLKLAYLAVSLLPCLVSCGPPQITYVPMPVPVGTVATTQPAPSSSRPPEKLAVLPIEDETLFRAERSLLRFELTGHLARVLPNRVIVPLADVDAKIKPASSSTGHLCAYEGEAIEKRARYKGWQYTRLMHVAGLEKGPGEELWVEIVEGIATVASLQGPWNSKIPRVDAYRGAFAAFVRNDDLGLVGGLAGSGSYEKALRDGPMIVCEKKNFGFCDVSSVDWQDRAGSAASCFSGVDEATYDLLVQGDVGPYCELENLEYTDGHDAKVETCLCKTLGTSSAMAKRPGRRTLRVHYEAPDLQGKTRPEMRVVEATTNIETEDDWHSVSKMVNGKKVYDPVRRLAVENLDALAAPLARCTIPTNTVVVADLDVGEDGAVTGGRVVSGGLDKPAQTCLEQAFGRGAFDCTNDGKSGRIRVAMEW